MKKRPYKLSLKDKEMEMLEWGNSIVLQPKKNVPKI
jgi:hypothetical protein